MQGIYCIRHLASGKVYIGSARDIARRWQQHQQCARTGTHHSQRFQHAWNKYGEDAFVFGVIEEVAGGPEQLEAREQHYLDACQSHRPEHGYNILAQAYSTRGYQHTAETKARMSQLHTGKTITAAHRAQLAETQRDRPKSAEHNQKNSLTKRGALNPNFGKQIPAEVLAKRRATVGVGAAHKDSKTYAFVNPAGERVEFTGLSHFCTQNALSAASMCDVHAGKQRAHKGWRKASLLPSSLP